MNRLHTVFLGEQKRTINITTTPTSIGSKSGLFPAKTYQNKLIIAGSNGFFDAATSLHLTIIDKNISEKQLGSNL